MRFGCIPSPSLRGILRRNEVRTMVANARLTASATDGLERTEEAMRQVHQAMYRFALGEITEEERRQIITLLQPCCPENFFAPKISEDQLSLWDLPGGDRAAPPPSPAIK